MPSLFLHGFHLDLQLLFLIEVGFLAGRLNKLGRCAWHRAILVPRRALHRLGRPTPRASPHRTGVPARRTAGRSRCGNVVLCALILPCSF